jgi:hypothetical protein
MGAAAAAKAKAKEGQVVVVREDLKADDDGWGGVAGSPPRSEFDAEDMDRYFRTRDELVSVAGSEPASLAYDMRRGYGRAQVRVHRARVSDSDGGEAYSSRRRPVYAHHE